VPVKIVLLCTNSDEIK